MNQKNVFKIGFSLFIILVFSTSFAWGFASDFLEEDIMRLSKYEVGEYCIFLQNIKKENTTQRIIFLEGSEHVINKDDITSEINVPVNTLSDDLPVCMHIRIPDTAKTEDKYLIEYGVMETPINKITDGMTSFNPPTITKKFYLTLPQEQESSDKTKIMIVLAFLIVVVLLIKKQQNEKSD